MKLIIFKRKEIARTTIKQTTCGSLLWSAEETEFVCQLSHASDLFFLRETLKFVKLLT